METKTTQCHPKPAVNATCLLGEKGCYKNGKCHYIGNCENKALTNADRIRAMSDEEIAQWLCLNYSCTKCLGKELCTISDGKANGLLKWLKQPAEE